MAIYPDPIRGGDNGESAWQTCLCDTQNCMYILDTCSSTELHVSKAMHVLLALCCWVGLSSMCYISIIHTNAHVDVHLCTCSPIPLIWQGNWYCNSGVSMTKDYMMHAVLVMCDVRNPDSTPHATNTRAKLVELLTPDVMAEKPMYGFEQVCGCARTSFCPVGGHMLL